MGAVGRKARAALVGGLLGLSLAGPARAADIGSVIVLPNEPYVIPVPDRDYTFPSYTSLDVLTQRNDNNRSGVSHWPGVNQHTLPRFRRLNEFSVSGVVTAQPLYVHSAVVQNVRQRVLIVATSTNDVYAFRPSESATDPLWHTTLEPPLVSGREGAGAACGVAENAAWPQQGGGGVVGIEATPVVDLANNQVLVGYKTDNGLQRLAALDLNTGRPKPVAGGQRSVVVRPPNAAANPEWHRLHRNRASLLLADGVVYLAFSSLCEGTLKTMHGSVVAFDARTLAQVGEFQVTDDRTDGGGIWQASTGLAADTRGNLYFLTGNRRLPHPCLVEHQDASPPDAANLSNSVVRVKTEKRTVFGRPPRPGEAFTLRMTVEDYFTSYRKMLGDCWDLDMASSGALLMPGTRFVVAGSKEGILYVLDRADMGGFENAGPPWNFAGIGGIVGGFHNAVPDDPKRDRVQQKFRAGFNKFADDYKVTELLQWPHIHGTPVFARFGPEEAYLFVWPEKDRLKRYRWRGDRFDPLPQQGDALAPPFITPPPPGRVGLTGMPGGMLSVNIDPSGPSLGVVLTSVKMCGWGTGERRVDEERVEVKYPRCDDDQNRGILRAYDPFTMRRVWMNDNDNYWYAKFVPPTVAAGRIFLPTASGKVIIYGP